MSADSILDQELQPYIRYADRLHFHNWRTPLRIISDYLLLHILEGTCRLVVENGAPHTVKAGQFCFVEPGTVHRFEAEGHVDLLSLHMDWFPSAASPKPGLLIPVEQGKTMEAIGIQPSLQRFEDIAIPCVPQPPGSDWLAETIKKVVALRNGRNAVDQLQAQLHATEIVLYLVKTYSTKDTKVNSLQWVPSYMQYRLAEPLSVKEMARKALMSPSSFTQRFRNKFGMPPHQYLLKLRLQYATELLLGTDLPLQAIAENCGFSSLHHFSKMYKLHVGYSPGKARQRQSADSF